MTIRNELELTGQLWLNGLVLWIALSVSSAVYFPVKMSAGVVVGGLLAVLNLALLKRIVKQALTPGFQLRLRSILIRFYLCFAATAAVIVVLMLTRSVDGHGLLLGLGVFIFSVFVVVAQVAGSIVYKVITKEAV